MNTYPNINWQNAALNGINNWCGGIDKQAAAEPYSPYNSYAANVPQGEGFIAPYGTQSPQEKIAAFAQACPTTMQALVKAAAIKQARDEEEEEAEKKQKSSIWPWLLGGLGLAGAGTAGYLYRNELKDLWNKYVGGGNAAPEAAAIAQAAEAPAQAAAIAQAAEAPAAASVPPSAPALGNWLQGRKATGEEVLNLVRSLGGQLNPGHKQ